jgi:hypothetical protein
MDDPTAPSDVGAGPDHPAAVPPAARDVYRHTRGFHSDGMV